MSIKIIVKEKLKNNPYNKRQKWKNFYLSLKDTTITGKRLFNEVTFNPNKANPGEEIYVNLPNLGTNMCLVPNSIFS